VARSHGKDAVRHSRPGARGGDGMQKGIQNIFNRHPLSSVILLSKDGSQRRTHSNDDYEERLCNVQSSGRMNVLQKMTVERNCDEFENFFMAFGVLVLLLLQWLLLLRG
jgi:hypothetical protein